MDFAAALEKLLKNANQWLFYKRETFLYSK